MPLVQFTEKLVEVTMVMRTSYGSPSTVPAVRRSGGCSNGGDDSDTGRCRATGKVRICCRNDTDAGQRDEPAIQKRMPNIEKIPKTVEIIHAVGQGQVPNIARTDEIPQAQFMPRRCTTNSCAETAPNIQEIQKTD